MHDMKNKLSTLLPFVLSLAALLLIVGYWFIHGPDTNQDEGAAAHIFQILMLGDGLAILYFAAAHKIWKIILLQVIAMIIPFCILYFFEHQSVSSVNVKDATYNIDNQSVTLQNGYSEENIDDSAVTVITKYFGNEVSADFNGDGVEDKAFLMTREPGGSGTFFYLVALVSKGSSFVGSNAIFLGDRIAPQTTEYRDGQIIVNYADREPDEPMTARPSMGVSKYFHVKDDKLEEIK